MVVISTYLNIFKICYKDRLVGEGSCKDWFEMPYQGKCMSRLEIPISVGGLMPSCTGKSDGIYRFDHPSANDMGGHNDFYQIGRVCDGYYKCSGGMIEVVKCENGTVFHMDSNTCKSGNSSLPNSCQLYCNPRKTFGHSLLMLWNVHIHCSSQRQQDDAKILLKLTVVHAKRKHTFVCINLLQIGIFSTYCICTCY